MDLFMTMILTCLTNEFIVQASDRRTTAEEGGETIPKDNNRNKALIYDNHTVLAHTGLAILEDQKFTIDWVAERLAQLANFQDAVAYLCECATQLMETPPFSGYSESDRRLGLVGGGFINWVEAGQTVRRPAYFVISNFMNHEGKEQPPPYNTFRAYYNYPLRYGESTFKLFRAGQRLPGDSEKQLNKTFKKYFQKKPDAVRPETIGWHLTHAIQDAAEYNKKVGKNVICTFVPRDYREDTGENREIHMGGMMLDLPSPNEEPQRLIPPKRISKKERFIMPPLLDVPRCVYIPDDDSSLPLYKAVNVFPGQVIPVVCTTDMVSTIPPVRSTGVGEMEITAGDWSISLTAKLMEGRKI
jgi:hypothetical protein